MQSPYPAIFEDADCLVAPATWNSAFLLSARVHYLPLGAGPPPLPTWLRQVKTFVLFLPRALNGRQFYPPASMLRGPLLSLPSWCLPAGVLAEFSSPVILPGDAPALTPLVLPALRAPSTCWCTSLILDPPFQLLVS